MSQQLKKLIKSYLQKAYKLGELTLQIHNQAVQEHCVEQLHSELGKEPGMLETYMATNQIEL